MDTLILLLLALSLPALLGALAAAFGTDSRDAFREANRNPSRRAPTDVA